MMSLQCVSHKLSSRFYLSMITSFDFPYMRAEHIVKEVRCFPLLNLQRTVEQIVEERVEGLLPSP